MENEIKKIKDEILCLREAIFWLTGEIANNNNWIGVMNKEIETGEFTSNKDGFYNRLRTIIGEKATWKKEVVNG